MLTKNSHKVLKLTSSHQDLTCSSYVKGIMIRRKSQIILVWILIFSFCFLFILMGNKNSGENPSLQSIAYSDFDFNLTSLNNKESWFFPTFSGKQRIFMFFGTRPEVIKMAPVIQTFRKSNQFFVKTIFTGQHAEIIKPFLKIFDINVDIWFNNTLAKGQSLNMLAGKLFLQIDRLPSEPNDIWMVQGDTTSAMVIATVAFHKKLRVAHVEAGLRTFNMYSPFPEEFNRKTISSVATYHFAPTENNQANLLNEGIDKTHIFVTGNTVIDAAKYMQLSNKTVMPNAISSRKFDILVLITLHRRENMNRMESLYKAIASVTCAKCLFIVPVHPNPQAGKHAEKMCSIDSRFLCVPPLAYEELQWMLGNSALILTDSGGIQEESTWYNVPTLVLRKDTERGEAVQAGIAKLVDEVTLKPAMANILDNLRKENKTKVYPYGDGNSALRILKILQTVKLPVANITIHPTIGKPPETKPLGEITPHYFDKFKDKKTPTISVLLQVYKRNTLQKQLDAVVKQTMVPSTVVVVQNGKYLNVSAIIQTFRTQHPKIEIVHFASSKNLRFHGRFHIAYMLEEDYVSIWDDDIIPRSQWLQYCVDYSRSNGHGAVGANGRTFEYIDVRKGYAVVQSEQQGRNDLVGHSWTLPRVYLRYYINIEPVSHYTGEDVQLAYALQHYGIYSYLPPLRGENSIDELMLRSDSNASYRKNQAPRFLLFCTLMKHDFKFFRCKNCADKAIVEKCIQHHEPTAIDMVQKAFETDKQENIHAWS